MNKTDKEIVKQKIDAVYNSIDKNDMLVLSRWTTMWYYDTWNIDIFYGVKARVNKYLKTRYPFVSAKAWNKVATYDTALEPYIKNIVPMINLFFDFYSINEIYSKTIGTQNAIRFDPRAVRIIPTRKEEVISRCYTETVQHMKTAVIRELTAAVYSEARHISTYCTGSDYNAYLTQVANSNKEFALNWDTNKLSLDNLEKFYSFRWTDKYYGGKKWKQAVQHLKQLLAAKTDADAVYWIDRIMDLEHNTGFILDKGAYVFLKHISLSVPAPSGKKKTNKNCLDFRFYAKLEDMIPMCSKRVQHIYTANKNYLVHPTVELSKIIEKKTKEKKAKSAKLTDIFVEYLIPYSDQEIIVDVRKKDLTLVSE